MANKIVIRPFRGFSNVRKGKFVDKSEKFTGRKIRAGSSTVVHPPRTPNKIGRERGA